MLADSFTQAKKFIANTLNIALISFSIGFAKSSLANSANDVSDLIQLRERSRQELYQINSRKIDRILLAVKDWKLKEERGESVSDDCQSFLAQESKRDENQSLYLFDLNRETFDIGLKLIKSPAKKLSFLEEQSRNASSIESSYQYMYSIKCVTLLSVMLSEDFKLKIQIMLAEEENK